MQYLTEAFQSFTAGLLELVGIGLVTLLGVVCVYVKRKFMRNLANVRLTSSLTANTKISRLLITLRVKIDAARVGIFLFHNGEYYINGNSILRASCAYEELAPGISSEKQAAQNVLLSTVPEAFDFLTQKTMRKAPIVMYTETVLSGYYRAVLESQGVEAVAKYPLFKEDKVIGVLIADYMHRDVPKADVLEEMKDIAPQIELALSEVRTKNWWRAIFEGEV